MRTPQTDEINEKAAQDIRHFYCDKEGDHVCVGQMLIDKDGLCLACKLCGVDDRRHNERIVEGDIKAQFILLVKKHESRLPTS